MIGSEKQRWSFAFILLISFSSDLRAEPIGSLNNFGFSSGSITNYSAPPTFDSGQIANNGMIIENNFGSINPGAQSFSEWQNGFNNFANSNQPNGSSSQLNSDPFSGVYSPSNIFK